MLGDGVGLTAENLRNVGRLAALAAGAPKSGRSDIYTAVALLYRVQGTQLSEQERTLVRDILKRLTLDVEMAIRISLAERLADDADAPLDLILLLVDDAVEVARPIILRSRRLTDRELVEFLAHADEARQAVCAERPNIGEKVTERLAASEAEPVLLALLRNATAKIGANTFQTLVEKSRRMAELQEPLARRADLPTPLATRLCGWASDAIKSYLIQSRRLDPHLVQCAVEEAARSVTEPSRPRVGNARKLVDKLAIAGQLKPGFLVRVLQQQQTELFDIAFARLLDVEHDAFEEAFYRRGPRPVALACRAVGIDRCVFPTIFSQSRYQHSINPVLFQEDRSEIEAVFGFLTRKEALEIFRRIGRH